MNNIAHFFAMGGYAIYVWPAYIITITFLFTELLRCYQRWRKFKRQISL